MSQLPLPDIVLSPPTPPASPAPLPQYPSPPTAPLSGSPISPLVAIKGETAATQVYRIEELRVLICNASSQRSLAKLMQLERYNSHLAAPFLYGRVTEGVAKSSFGLSTSRQSEYCNAIRTIDLSPPTNSLAGQELHQAQLRDSPKRGPKAFNPKSLSKRLPLLRKRYPGLRKLVDHYPTINGDEAFIAYIGAAGKLESVSVETLVELDINCYFTTDHNAPILPPPPTYLGLFVRHTLIIRLVDGGLTESYGADRGWRNDTQGLSERQTRWKRWLYANGGPDQRVSGVEQHSVPSRLRINLTLAEALTYIGQRHINLCAPLSHFDLTCEAGITSVMVTQLLEALGPDIRVLRINQNCLGGQAEIQNVIRTIGRASPILDSLHLDFPPLAPDTPLFNVSPLSGIVNLRTFSCSGHRMEEKGSLARYICGLGSPSCVFLDPTIVYADGNQSLGTQVQLARR